MVKTDHHMVTRELSFIPCPIINQKLNQSYYHVWRQKEKKIKRIGWQCINVLDPAPCKITVKPKTST